MRTTLRVAAAVVASTILLSLGAARAEANEPGLESQFVAQVNAVRANAGLPPLATDGELTAVARGWADTMAAENRIFHNPNLAGSIGANWVKIGENVGTGTEVGAVMQAFVNSAAHYRNIVDADFDYIGVGVTFGSDGRMYTAHVFMDLDGGAAAPAPTPVQEPEPSSAPAPAPVVTDPEPAADVPPAAPPVPVPPAAAAPERVAVVLALIGALDAGVR